MHEIIRHFIKQQEKRNKLTTVGKPKPNWLCKGKILPRLWVTPETLKKIKK